MNIANKFYRKYYGLDEFKSPVDESTEKFFIELEKELTKESEQEFERLSLDNYKIRRMLIKEENELIHLTMGKKRWKQFCEFLYNTKEYEKGEASA